MRNVSRFITYALIQAEEFRHPKRVRKWRWCTETMKPRMSASCCRLFLHGQGNDGFPTCIAVDELEIVPAYLGRE